MITISSSQDLEDNPNLIDLVIDSFFYRIAGINITLIFIYVISIPATAIVYWFVENHLFVSQPKLAKACSLVQSLLTCGLSHLWKKIPWLCGGVGAPYFVFEGGNLLLNLTPVTNT